MAKVAKSHTQSRLIILLVILILAIAGYFMLKPTESNITVSEQGLEELLSPQTSEEQMQYQAGTSEDVDLNGIEITPLDLSLLGTISSDTPEQSSATIQSKMQVRTYFIGDQIAYSNATLIQIENDRVILLNEGVEQVLLIQGTASSDNANLNAEYASNNQDEQQNLGPKTPKQIGNRPSKLKHIVTLDMDDMSISSGMNPKLYRTIGFKEGDKLQKVNGIDSTDFSQLTLIDNAIGNTQVVEFVVLRDGKLLSLYLDIPTKALSLSN